MDGTSWNNDNLTMPIPGVMQFESNLSSLGKTWPFSNALRMLSSASLADLLVKINNQRQVNIQILYVQYK